MESLTTSARNVPKMSTPTLEVRRNYYVIPDGQRYHYFPITVSDDRERPFIRFSKAPPVLMEGIAIIGEPRSRRAPRLYHVPLQDLMRGLIRKSREIKPANRVATNGSTGNPTDHNSSDGSDQATTSTGGECADRTVQRVDQQRAGDLIEMEVCEAADLAWTEQIDALLHHLSEKEGEEWEIADPAQSRQVDESSAIQNLERDSGES